MVVKSPTSGSRVRPVVLVILDGWGIARPNRGNAVTRAKTPVLHNLMRCYPHTRLDASGPAVGLPEGQPGNSEAGHLNLGAGRVVLQDVVKITREISTGAFFRNAAFVAAIRHVKRRRSALHLMGLLSREGSAHACPDHLTALLVLARRHRVKRVFLHLFTDGRDSPTHAALKLMSALERGLETERVATVMGRFYAMDRKKDWRRTQAAYEAIVSGGGKRADSPQAAITEAYNRDETDEFIPPYVIHHGGRPVATVRDGDAVIFYNLRSDRARQLTKALVQERFEALNPGSFRRSRAVRDLAFAAMTDFGPDLGRIHTAYVSEDVPDSLPRVLAGRRQLYVAETEKYAHVTFFFNGGFADAVGGEERLRIDSPDVRSYADQPEMSAAEVTEQVVWAVPRYDFITVNLANPDMVGHTGNLAAGIRAVEFVDRCVGRIAAAVIRRRGTMLVTADHGNVEEMINLKTGEVDTEHSTNPVPFLLVTPKRHRLKSGRFPLASIAPTICQLLHITPPAVMTGTSLLAER